LNIGLKVKGQRYGNHTSGDHFPACFKAFAGHEPLQPSQPENGVLKNRIRLWIARKRLAATMIPTMMY